MFSARRHPPLLARAAPVLLLLTIAWHCAVVQLNPVAAPQLANASDSRARLTSGSYNKTCITENIENGTHLTIISSSMVTAGNTSSPTAAFNERRRDMFFEDYNIKQIEVIDTSVVPANNSTHDVRPGPVRQPSVSSPPLVSVNPITREPPVVSAEQSDSSQMAPILPQRHNVLAPKLSATGRPACVQSPDDTFCEIVDNYPNKSSIKTEMDLSPQQFNDIFGPKEIDARKSYVDPESDEESVCRKVPRVIYPQMAKNQANQWVYVVNEVEYTQAVVAEICEKPGKPCTHLENLPMGMYSRCKQKYSYKRLLALHPTEKRTYPEAFKFPSCCSCYIKYQDDYVGRSNFRKLEGKVDVTEQRNSGGSQQQQPAVVVVAAGAPRESRVLSSSTEQNETTIIETTIIEPVQPEISVHHQHIDNSTTIEIMSQSAELTAAAGQQQQQQQHSINSTLPPT